MGGGDDHRASAGRLQGRHIDPVRVDRDGDRGEARREDGRAHRSGTAGILVGDGTDPAAGQRLEGEGQPLGVAGADEGAVRFGGGRADPAHIGGDDRAQLPAAARIPVAEVGGRHPAGRLADRPQPVGTREGGQVGHAVPEVGDQTRGLRRALGRRLDGGGGCAGSDTGGRAHAGDQVALGLQLGVGVLDQAAGQAEGAGQFPRGGEAFVHGEAAAADRVPQLPFQLDTQLLTAAPVDGQQQLGRQTGPLHRHEIGSYR